jgi:hypothetical protein
MGIIGGKKDRLIQIEKVRVLISTGAIGAVILTAFLIALTKQVHSIMKSLIQQKG